MKNLLLLFIAIAIFACKKSDVPCNKLIDKDYSLNNNIVVNEEITKDFFDYLENKTIPDNALKSKTKEELRKYLTKNEFADVIESTVIPVFNLDHEKIKCQDKIKSLKHYINENNNEFVLISNKAGSPDLMVGRNNSDSDWQYSVNRLKKEYTIDANYRRAKDFAGCSKVFAVRINRIIYFAFWKRDKLNVSNFVGVKGHYNQEEIIKKIKTFGTDPAKQIIIR